MEILSGLNDPSQMPFHTSYSRIDAGKRQHDAGVNPMASLPNKWDVACRLFEE